MMCQATNEPEYDRYECDALVFGSLIKGLKRLRIWPTIRSSEDYQGSVSELIKGLHSLHCFVLDGRNTIYPEHASCLFTLKLHSEIKRIKDTGVPSGVHESHREHMKQQALK